MTLESGVALRLPPQSKFLLAKTDFVLQSYHMNPNWAEENLQTIRTLMERSALYRRALAPIMIFIGLVGLAAAAGGMLFRLKPDWTIFGLWPGAALVAVTGAFLIARRQAIKERTPFWSPPTRRVAQALLPPLTAGMCMTLVFKVIGLEMLLPLIWALFYGCALHSAGFFMPRGIKYFGWIYIGLASGILVYFALSGDDFQINDHWLMGFFFGALQLAYGIYLCFTEKKNLAA